MNGRNVLNRKFIILAVVVIVQLLIGSISLDTLPFINQSQQALADNSSLVAYIERWDEPRGEWRHWGTLGTSLSQLELELRGTESQNRSTATIVRYEWDFGDGDTAAGEYVSHTYQRGSWYITLTVYDGEGNSASETLKINVGVSDTLVAYIQGRTDPSEAWFHWGTLGTSMSQLELELRGTESQNRYTGTIVRYEWDFGDGDTAVGEYVSHTYQRGSWYITLTIYDDEGNSDSETLKIEVRGEIPPSPHTHLLAVISSRFDSIADLDGARIAVPFVPEACQWMQTALVTYGISFLPLYIPSSLRLDALQIGIVDAVLVTYHPWSYLEGPIASGEVRLLRWSNEAVQAVRDAHPTTTIAAWLPAGTYEGQTRSKWGYAPTLAFTAAQLAKAVIGPEYLWGGKGWDWELRTFAEAADIKAGYRYHWPINGTWPEKKPGLDCSGLVFWVYNKAHGATTYLSGQNPVQYESADGQYRNNFKQDVDEAGLSPGDLLFFDFVLNSDYTTPTKDGLMDHVAVYVGPFNYGGQQYDCVHASYGAGSIVADTKDRLKTWRVNGVLGFEKFRRLTEPQVFIRFKAFSPVDLAVTDPDGLTVTKEICEIAGIFYYVQCDVDDDGDLDSVVVGSEKKLGDYLITVVPKPGVEPTDTYSLEVVANNTVVVLAEGVQIGDILSEGYVIRSTEAEIVQIILATIDFDPDTLNLASSGKFVTVYIELPPGHDVGEIDISSIVLNGVVAALDKSTQAGDYDNDAIPDLMVKFDRAAVQEILTAGDQAEITVSGEVAGITFEGSDAIRVIGE